jgi:cytoskeletal protein CcmA (bactofilin family)
MNRKILFFALLLSAAGTAAADDNARAMLGGNAFMAGGYVELDDRVARNAFLSGGNVAVTGQVGRSLFAAGGDVRLEGEVDGDAHMAGGTLRLSREAEVGGDATLAGGSIAVDGSVGGDLDAYGERVALDGSVGGDVRFAGDTLRLGPNARVAGELTYRSSSDIVVEPGAQVSGGIHRSMKEPSWRRGARGAAILGGITVSLGMMLLGAVLVLGMPRFSRDTGRAIRRKPWQVLGLGCAMLVGVPIALALLAVTIVGIPLAVLLAFAYGALLMLGYLVGAIFVGDFVLERVNAARLDSVWWRALFLLIAIIAIAVLHRVPVIGDLAWCLLFLAGIGAFTMRAWQGLRDEPSAVSR